VSADDRRVLTNRRKGIVVVVLVVAVGLAAAVGWLASRPISPVTVIVKNNSQKRIASVRLEHERGVEIAENLAPGEARTIRFQAGGENSYTLRVRFADGSEMRANPRYVESGYKMFEAVSDSGITTDGRLPRY